jgi:fermentation-respiration switch protein FrsA (DUF1100 family)
MTSFVDRLIFVPPRPTYGEGLEGLVRLASAGGEDLAGLFIPTARASLAVLFAHGNAEDLGHMQGFLSVYASLGVSVLAVDYPGYGLSTGKASESGAYAAAQAGLDFLREAGYETEMVVLHGRSLGGAVAAHLAAGHPVAGLILESTFTSAFRVMLPVDGLPGDRFNTLAKIPSVEAPVLVIHGTLDEVVSPRHSQRLLDLLPRSRRRAWFVDGAGHNDLAAVAGEAYWRRLADFLAAIMSADDR